MTVDEMFDTLEDLGFASDETIRIITAINGWNVETAEDILYATTGYRNFDQLKEEC